VLKILQVEGDFYEMKIPAGVRTPTELPRIKFLKNQYNEITGLEFVYADGRKDGPYHKH